MASLKKLDTSKLTKSQKIQLYEAIQEKKRRLRAKKPQYKPHEGQIEIHKNESIERYVFCGNGFGKTACAVHEAVWAAQGYNPLSDSFSKVPCRVIVVLDSPDKVRDTWLPEIAKWFETDRWNFEKQGKPYISRIGFPNGSEIKFMFHLQEQMAFESIEWGFCVMDEPPPRHVYIALKRGGRTKGYKPRMLVIGTPIAATWLRKEVYEPWSRGDRTNTTCFKYSSEMNKENLAEGYLEEFASVLTEEERRIRLEGDFFDLSGLALAHLFERDKHLIEPFHWPVDWPCVVIVDVAMSKPHQVMLLGCDHEGRLYYIKEFSSTKTPREFARQLRKFYEGYSVIDIVADSLGSSRMSGGDGTKSFIEVLNEEGVRIRATRYDEKSDEEWIARIRSVLEIPEGKDNFGRPLPPTLRIFNNCTQIISDIESVQWLKVKHTDIYKPKLDIANKDALACLKYGLACQLQYGRRRDRIIKPSGSKGVSWRDRVK